MKTLTNEHKTALSAFMQALGVDARSAAMAADAAIKAVRNAGLESVPDIARRRHCSRRLVWLAIHDHHIPYIPRGGRQGSLVDGDIVDAAMGGSANAK